MTDTSVVINNVSMTIKSIFRKVFKKWVFFTNDSIKNEGRNKKVAIMSLFNLLDKKVTCNNMIAFNHLAQYKVMFNENLSAEM